MTVAEQIQERIRGLSEDDQRKVLAIAEALGRPTDAKPLFLDRYADLGIVIDGEAIDEGRKELAASFPRDIDLDQSGEP